MKEQLMEIVAKHLPEMQMEVLREELEKVEKIPALEKEISNLRKRNEDLSSANSKLVFERDEYAKEATAVRMKREELEKMEKTLHLALMKEKLDCEMSKTQLTKDLFGLAFRNPVFQKSVHEMIPVANPNSGYIEQQPRDKTETTQIKPPEPWEIP